MSSPALHPLDAANTVDKHDQFRSLPQRMIMMEHVPKLEFIVLI